MNVFELTGGQVPLLVSFPHAGTEIPRTIADTLTETAFEREDTDWHLPRLYEFVRFLGASTLVAKVSRYVIDLNRPPQDESLYPGRDTTGLVPRDTFRRVPLYRDGAMLTASDIAERRERYWRPYHEALGFELARLRARHGIVLLWDAHSIASVLPRLFDGRLPDLNLGTVDRASCDPDLQLTIADVMAGQSEFTSVVDGRFKGGYITRHYGKPREGIHAVQLEMTKCSYMDEQAPFGFDEQRAARIRPLLERMVVSALSWTRRRARP